MIAGPSDVDCRRSRPRRIASIESRLLDFAASDSDEGEVFGTICSSGKGVENEDAICDDSTN